MTSLKESDQRKPLLLSLPISTISALPEGSSKKMRTEEPHEKEDTLASTPTAKGNVPNVEQMCVDGNWAVAHAAYRMNEMAFIFPITPSSPMGEIVDAWAEDGRRNLWGRQELKVIEMQSEAGAAGALHGALVSGSLATTFTASQGLLLYIPNLYKMAGELLPTVIHVASRALAGQALSIYGDHSDTMMIRGCGLAMVSSFSVQEAHDMAIISQIATLKSRLPFLHFFDGFRTSHEINKISLVSDDSLRKLMPNKAIEEHRQRALSPLHPSQRGTAQSPDVFMQLVESSNQNYNSVGGIIEQVMEDFFQEVGRRYHPFEYSYFGTTKPTVAIITMGSSVKVVEGTLRFLKTEQACLIGVRMFRPWDPKLFVDVIPASVKRIAVLDRTREGGSQGEPLYLDVCTSLLQRGRRDIFVAGGRYGLGSKDFTPRMAISVIQNMLRKDVDNIQQPFTVGIDDDVTNLSLPLGRPLNTLSKNTKQCVFWGFGSDGTVGGNKNAIKIIGDYHDTMSVQGYFEYDAKKSSGWTVSYLRFSPTEQIDAPFRIEEGQANYVACHNESYVQAGKFDVVKHLKRRGSFFLNTQVASIEDPEKRIEALENLVSPKILRKIALRQIKFFIMDAASLAAKYGLAGRINMICMATFFRLSGVLPLDDAINLLKSAIHKTYAYKGEAVVKKNHDLLDAVVSDPKCLLVVDVPNRWRQITEGDRPFENRHISLINDKKVYKFMSEIVEPMSQLEGDSIPISKFLENNLLGGIMITGTTKYEKRNPNPTGQIPEWDLNKCTQCNQCVFVCPHAAIRPFIVSKEEALAAPYAKKFETVKASGADLVGTRYTLQISPLDCTGCNACVEACPESPKALKLGDIEDVLEAGEKNWDYAVSLPQRGDMVDKYSVRGSQFQTPLMEFSGACGGCGETPYFKLLTQLFGERMVIANATGCSSIWGGSFPSNPYTVSPKTGRGPAWANSLFEDNAEYGFGMFAAMRHRREKLIRLVQDYVHHMQVQSEHGDKSTKDEEKLVSLLEDWLEAHEEKTDKCSFLFDKIKPLLNKAIPEKESSDETSVEALLLSQIWAERDMFPKISQWIVGGDGWAYDIGFGGLDHVEAFESNDVNVLIVDTEMYSNTGGQASKATPRGASVKYAIGGKQERKKNIGEIFMTYEHVYVASVAIHDQAQTLRAFVEADSHNGPSLIIAYAPCIQQGVRPAGLNDMIDESRYAVESGYWPLYRFNPELAHEGKNPFILDAKKLRKEISGFLKREGRFINLKKAHPEIADELFAKMNNDVHHRMEHLKELAAGYKAFDHKDDATVQVLFASETGTAAQVARDFADACTLSHDADAMDNTEVDDLDGHITVFVIATAGQGAMPENGKRLYQELESRKEPFSEGTRFMVMGLGDSSYYFFCKAAKDVERKMLKLGAKQMVPTGMGDDSAEDGMQQGLHEWLDTVWPTLEVPPPVEVPHITPVKVIFSKRAILPAEEDEHMLQQFYQSADQKAMSTQIISNDLLCPADYNRDFRKITIQKRNGALDYGLGDALDIFPTNDVEKVHTFLHEYSPDFDERTVVKLHAWGMDGDISLGVLFTNVLDLFGKPSMHFLQQLATFETDEEDRSIMLDLQFLKDQAKKTGITHADVLMRFKKAHPPLPALLAMIPLIKPRAYSIASAPVASPDTIELCVLINTWWTEEEEHDGMRYGLTCDMLRNLRSGDRLWCRIKSGSMEAPSPDQPVVCAGIGSGLAPHLAFLRDRVYRCKIGEVPSPAPFSLYFGNRFYAKEFLYQNELEEYVEAYGKSWFTLHTAFSRDDPSGKKVYVQDLVGRTEDARKLLREDRNGMLYVCGNQNLPKPLQHALVRSFSQKSTDQNEIAAATAVMEDMFVHGRAQQEVW